MLKHQNKVENLLYVIVWVILYVSPILSLYTRSISGNGDDVFQMREVVEVWKIFTGYLIVFLIHNFILAPLLVYYNKAALYWSLLALLIVLFQINTCVNRPKVGPPGMEVRSGMMGQRPPEFPDVQGPMGPEGMRPDKKPDAKPDNKPGGMGGPGAMGSGEHRMDEAMHHKGDSVREGRPFDRNSPNLQGRKSEVDPVVGELDYVAFIVVMLMIGLNLGVKYYQRYHEERERLVSLEKENLEQQLEYLKYQISPHFFMNTLNNIHALVDIDPEEAKVTIEELSKMMRYVLYEGNKKFIPLEREVLFITNYVSLMKIRYTDKVKINMSMPEQVPDIQVPPLLFITFIENAFKHGVSYQQESLIDITLKTDNGRVVFGCKNSKKPVDDEHGGVGMENTKKRLDLLYGDSYRLDVSDEEKYYEVTLVLDKIKS